MVRLLQAPISSMCPCVKASVNRSPRETPVKNLDTFREDGLARLHAQGTFQCKHASVPEPYHFDRTAGGSSRADLTIHYLAHTTASTRPSAPPPSNPATDRRSDTSLHATASAPDAKFHGPLEQPPRQQLRRVHQRRLQFLQRLRARTVRFVVSRPQLPPHRV